MVKYNNLTFVLIFLDPFGARLVAAGISPDTIKSWSVDPQVKGKSLFDQLEDTDAEECVEKAKALAN